jgi:uncharacterized membrane-anchored protein
MLFVTLGRVLQDEQYIFIETHNLVGQLRTDTRVQNIFHDVIHASFASCEKYIVDCSPWYSIGTARTSSD